MNSFANNQQTRFVSLCVYERTYMYISRCVDRIFFPFAYNGTALTYNYESKKLPYTSNFLLEIQKRSFTLRIQCISYFYLIQTVTLNLDHSAANLYFQDHAASHALVKYDNHHRYDCINIQIQPS